ncbi:U4/U6-U5 snRNP complex subunit SNU66 [Saccharomyces paradoxus]|uniref:U4/U6-U5 snRNP complex subunit SNU66 n=1 Tax=Saccharomyces paradoxus TaxID=27291 RepID=A0A8B8V0C6_SACPA|nr:Snu66 [Saccharomyces paradoxus]QHS76391.1 Snu66 [Saccharomyces paradoxus]
MNKKESLSIEETNEIREKLGLKPIPVLQEENAGRKESLSIQETNELRASLGLKLIPPQQNQNVSPPTIHTTAEVDILREKITKLQKANIPLRMLHLLEETGVNDDSSWLENLNAITALDESKASSRLLPRKGATKEDEDIDLHNVEVSYNIETLSAKKDTILTLKESSIFDETDSVDVLENEKAAGESTEREGLRLRQMNKDRRQKKKILNVSSLDIEEEEKEEHSLANTHLIIGAEQGIAKAPKGMIAKLPTGKVKVNFDGANDILDEDGGDYKPLKIKKRRIKDPKSTKARKLKIAHKMDVVKLVDEDESFSWMNEEQPVTIMNPRSSSKNELKAPEDLAIEIEKTRNEEKRRTENILKMRENSNNIIVDEKVTFLDTLDMGLPEGNTTANKLKVDDEGEKNVGDVTGQHFKEASGNNKLTESVNTEPNNEGDIEDAPDFFSGLASALGFLRKKSVLTPGNAGLKAEKGTNDSESLRKGVRNKEPTDTTSYTKDGLHGLKQSEASNSPNNISSNQRKRQSHYDPEIQLVYRDEKGNQLTTKEAYKKLSQKFHGTKSNKKKRAKMQSRIEARKNAFENDNLFEFDNS